MPAVSMAGNSRHRLTTKTSSAQHLGFPSPKTGKNGSCRPVLIIIGLLLACFLVVSVIIHKKLEQWETVEAFPLGASSGTNPRPSLSSEDTYPLEDPIPNPEPADGEQTFAACLLVMDDNHRLIEWMAYHVHVLPLRYIIVTVDPRSTTSPTYIWNRWRRHGVYIDVWQDNDFWRSRNESDNRTLNLKPIEENADLQTKRDRHRGRQKYFFRSCLLALKEVNRTWVALLDTDEFLVYNHAGGDKYDSWEKRMQELHDQSAAHGSKARIKPSRTPPTTGEAGAMIKYIRQEQAAGLQSFQSPCIGVPRLQFGSKESKKSIIAEDVPSVFNPRKFDTLRWRKHAGRNDFVKNALGKVIMDVSRIDIAKSPYFQSLHRPIKQICKAPWNDDWKSGLRINHYLGSWESYSFRDDARRGGERSREQWEYKAFTNIEETDDNIRPWLSGFVARYGVEQAQMLLRGVGELPKIHRSKNNRTVFDPKWSLSSDRLEKILSTNQTVANDNKMVAFDAWVRAKYRARKEQ